jgi:hypothetical protein
MRNIICCFLWVGTTFLTQKESKLKASEDKMLKKMLLDVL